MFQRKTLSFTLALTLSLLMAPLAFAQMGNHHGGGTSVGDHGGTGHYMGDGHAHNAVGTQGHFTGDGHNHGGAVHSDHQLDDGHIHHAIGSRGHFTGDGHNHSRGHAGHDHGSLVRGMNRFSVKGVVDSIVLPDPIDSTTPVTMTVTVQHASRALRDLVDPTVTFTISPNAFVKVYGVGPGVVEDILAGDTVKVMGSIFESTVSTDSTSPIIYEASQIVVY